MFWSIIKSLGQGTLVLHEIISQVETQILNKDYMSHFIY